jgi:uncharacterized repeat protein (TIGR01451 family)
MRNTAGLAAFAALLLLDPSSVRAQQPNPSPILSLGNAVVTAFSGTVAPDPRHVPRTKSAIDLTFINPDAAAARIFDVRAPGFAWDARNWPAPKTFDVFARDTGQVFGIALDGEPSANIYLTATSAYGLQIVVPGASNRLERVTKGQQQAIWMNGQFGLALGGGPGSIWKVDGRTGQVSLFANVTLNGASNAGPGLGNIAFDRAHRQLFASDLSTGMIHRFDLTGRELQTYDHGVIGRPTRNLPPVALDPSRRVEITDSRFDSENPDSWGFTAPERRVFAVAIHPDGRLYYSVWDGPQIWSVSIQPDGSFGNDPRWELDVPATPRSFPVSDMVFSDQGAMILAQRGGIVSSYDYSVFARPGEARVLRYTLEQPDDPATPSRWIAQPQEYAIGFRGDFRNTDGGVDLGYGYTRDGRVDTNSCATALWTTGESLRDNPTYATRLQPGGPLTVNGLQASPADQVRDRNTPPWTAYFIDYGGRYNDARASGHIGSVRILRADCAGPIAGPGVTPPVPPVGPPPLCPQGLNPDGTCGRVPIDLAIKKTASQGKYDPATGTWTFQFTLTVTNVGNPFTPANHIVVNDPVPNGLTFTAAAGTNWTCSPTPVTAPNALNCSYNFGPGQIATGAALPPLAITVTVTNAGKYENCATTGIAGAPWLQETTLANNRSCAPIEVPVDIAIVKTAELVRPGPPATYTFTLTVTNPGAAFTTANVVTVADPPPVGMTFTAASGTNWNCPVSQFPVNNPSSLSCTYTGPGTAHNAVVGTILVTATIANPGVYENCASTAVSAAARLSEVTLENNKSCIKIKVPDPVIDLAIAKAVAAQTGTAGGYTFTLAVTNVGPAFTGTNVITVTDVVPAGMTFTGASATNWTCTPATVNAGGTLTCTYTGSGPTAPNQSLGTITINATGSGPFENCAVVGVPPESGFQDSNPQNNRACVSGGSDLTGYFNPGTSPGFNPQCGMNVIYVVDASDSIGTTPGAYGEIINALNSTASLFNTNGSKAALIYFSDIAQTIQPLSSSTYGLLTNAYNPFTPSPLTSPHLQGGATNWQAAMTQALGLIPSAQPNVVIILLTDGTPTAIGNGTPELNPLAATNAAITAMQSIYQANVPVIAIGVGPAANQPQLQALVGAGGVTYSGGYSDTTNILQQIGHRMCPDLYLTKSLSPGTVDFHNPGPYETTITLTVTNYTTTPLTGINVQDVLPTLLTNPTLVSASSGTFTPGSTVNWTGISLGPNASATLSFKVTVTKPPALTPMCTLVRNFSQVTHVDQAVNSHPDSFTDLQKQGPVVEHDESSAALCIRDYTPIDTGDCGNSYLAVSKTKDFNEVCTAGPAGVAGAAESTCKFTITVQARCKPFNGPVLFGDGLFSGPPPTTPINPTIASITSNPAVCPWSSAWSSTTAPTSCQTNISLAVNQSITFTVTVAGPLTGGDNWNCFIADGKSPTLNNFPAGYTDANPALGGTQGVWGHCISFGAVAARTRPVVAQCDPATTVKRGNICVCRIPGMVKSSETACACPTGTNLVPGRGCVPPLKCDPPKIPNAANTACVCPEGTLPRGRECVKQPICQPPMIPAPGGARPGAPSCVCPQGTVQQGQNCVKQTVCQPPMIPAPGAGRNNRVEGAQRCVCPPPMVPGSAGGRAGAQTCVCPPGTVQRGRDCVKQTVCPPPMVPGPAAVYGAAGAQSCVCPQGTVQQGRDCVRPGPTRPQGGPATPGGAQPNEPARTPAR